MNRNYEKLDSLIHEYCKAKNLIVKDYYDGIFSQGNISDSLVLKLIEYHKEWLKK